MPDIRIKSHSKAYTVRTGYGASETLPAVVEKLAPGRVFVVFDAQVESLYGREVLANLRRAGLKPRQFVVNSQERYKSLTTLRSLYAFLLEHKISRQDLIVAVGGGIVTDLSGFAAATVLRGVRWAAVPTTLLGMVDAAIGGKTGVNHDAGKNLVGAFWQPEFVICDPRFLETLQSRHIIAGMGEVVKYAGLDGEPMLKWLHNHTPEKVIESPAILSGIINTCVRSKGRIVERDENDIGVRQYLNLGHTFAHGLETASAGRRPLLHGEAVLIGLLAACGLSELYAEREISSLRSYRSIIEQYIRLLPYRTVSVRDAWQYMKVDKKRRTNGMRFVLLRRIGQPFLADDVVPEGARMALRGALRAFARIRGER